MDLVLNGSSTLPFDARRKLGGVSLRNARRIVFFDKPVSRINRLIVLPATKCSRRNSVHGSTPTTSPRPPVAPPRTPPPTPVSRLLGRPRQASLLDQLAAREREVLELLAEGLSNSAIAQRLVVTERTVEAHVKQIFAKLDITASSDSHRRVLAVLAYLRG
jgi:DNA-binding CsgD family transcriptional regulator